MKEYWRLTIMFTWSSVSVCGTEDVLRTAIDEWRAYLESDTYDEHEACTILGFTDTADRAPCEFTFLLHEARGMSLVRMS